MKLNRYFTIISVGAALCLASCTKDFTNKNTNPDNADEDMMKTDNLLTGSSFSQMARNVLPTFQLLGETEYGSASYQVIEDLAGNIFAGYTGQINTGFTGNNLYNVKGKDWYNKMFDDAYTRVIAPWAQLDAQRETFPEVVAMGDILKVAAMQRVTDTYGPIPYLKAGSGTIKNEYDAQKVVYEKFFAELDHAISLLTTFYQAEPQTKLLDRYDPVYGGDVGAWIKFANTLRLRLALRVVYADAALAKTQAEAAVANPVGVMTSAADIAQIKKPNTGVWEYPMNIIQYDFDDARIGATIECYMNGYADPRRAKYFTANAEGQYRGVRTGINITAAYASSKDKLSRVNCTRNDAMVWMVPAEAFFLRAEGALRGWTMGGDAKALYEEGIRVAFATSGVGGADSYITDKASTPAAYTDVAVPGNSVATPPSGITIAWQEGNFEQSLERIITQKYIAMFPIGTEAWSEFRRTGYPKVLKVTVNNSGGVINSDKQIRRLNFPSTEYSTNAEAVARAAATLNGESKNATGDNGGTNVWWDKK